VHNFHQRSLNETHKFLKFTLGVKYAKRLRSFLYFTRSLIRL
jgi:hypothetical protein